MRIFKSTEDFKGQKVNRSGGFTMLEMLVSLGIFSIVALVAVGALVRITSLNRQAQSLQTAMNSISFALESMSREMRVGTAYKCIRSAAFSGSDLSHGLCSGGGDNKAVLFKSSEVDPANPNCHLIYAYWFDKTGTNPLSFRKSRQTVCGGQLISNEASPLFDETNVKLTGYELDVIPESKGYYLLKVRIMGYVGKKPSEQSTFDIRTAISERISS